jgi:hypothetical protein
MAGTNVENTNPYIVDDANPLEQDVEFDLPMDSDIEELEDGSVLLGAEDEPELPNILEAPHNANLVSYFTTQELGEIADDLVEAWKEDDKSREEWKSAYTKGLDLLGIQIEEKSEPFLGASGVYHPLLAEATVQFQAQAYKEILPPGGPVLGKVVGDETSDRIAQANRVQDYLNYQILDIMEEYDEDMDQLLFYLPLSGSAFKKVYHDPVLNRSVSEFIMADHLTVPYGTKSLATAIRISHDFILGGNRLLEYQATGFYSSEHTPDPIDDSVSDEITDAVDELQGTSGGYYQHDTNYQIVEMHTDLDHPVLSGMPEDEELIQPARPYIITLDPQSRTVLSIRRNTEQGKDKRLDYFVHYKFLPGLGFYGFGLIHMIGGLTTSVTSILRQLIDAGTFSNLPGGLKTKGIRIEGENTPIAPGEFRDVDAPTGSVRDAVMPLPYKEPSAVLAALLGTLVESGQRFASIADMQVGDTGGQQQPVGTTVAMLERGTKVMSAIHKRIHNAQKKEFKILVRLVKETMPDEKPYPYSVQGADRFIMKADFDDRVDIIPVSDPNIFSMAQRVMIASQQLQMAQAAPEIHNLREAYRRMYIAMGVSDVETLLKPEKKPLPLTPLEENRKVLQNQKLVAVPEMNHEAHIKAHILFLKTPYVMTSMEFAANIVQDIMGHITLLAKQKAGGSKEQAIAIELSMFEEILPQLQPPLPPKSEQAKLQERQLDIEERDDLLDASNKALEIKSKEKIAHSKNITDILTSTEAARGKMPPNPSAE